MTKPAVLILCTHNAGGSQMAMGFFKHLAGEQASVYSGGSEPARAVNPAAIAAMAERGIDITTEQPKRWMPDMLESADVRITMGCGTTPIERYMTWRRDDGSLQDPWLRLHERMGARMRPPAPKSYRIDGTVGEWESWLGMAFPESGDYVFPGGLSPLAIDREADRGTYLEPNVWMIHNLSPVQNYEVAEPSPRQA
jgi:protein-tyrosine-phosphatase